MGTQRSWHERLEFGIWRFHSRFYTSRTRMHPDWTNSAEDARGGFESKQKRRETGKFVIGASHSHHPLIQNIIHYEYLGNRIPRDKQECNFMLFGALRMGSKERTGLSSYIPARASLGSRVVGVVKSVRCSGSGSGVQTVSATERRGAVIDGKSIAGQIRKEIAAEVAALKESLGKVPGLAVVLVGTRKDSETYVRSKKKACEEVGFASFGVTLPEDSTQEDVLNYVKQFNDDPEVHGILVQLPLPEHINEEAVLGTVSFEKDVDGFHPINVGTLCMQGRKPLFVSCTPKGCIELLVRSGVQMKGKRAVVIGRSNIVGTPAAQLLQRQNATVTVVHSATPNPAEIVREADIVIAAVGKAELVRGDWLKPGAVVIDVGINAVDDPSTKKGYRLVGDVNYVEASEVASMITPVPGGVGPMTIAMLLSNTLDAAKRSFGVEE